MSKKNLKKAGGHAKEQQEFHEEVIKIDRVTRVAQGGRQLRFRATVAIGNKKGKVGVGVGKASEVVIGIQKAVAQAKANLVHVPITEGSTIPHTVDVHYKAAHLLLMPAAPGTGVKAGGPLRKILHLAGVNNVLSKSFGTRNPLVTAQASIKALQSLRPIKKTKKQLEEEAAKTEENPPVALAEQDIPKTETPSA